MSRFVRVFRAGFLYPALFLFIVFIATPCVADFRFAVIGDSRGHDDGINTEVLLEILKQIKSENVDFIVVVGDLITGSKHSGKHRDRLIKWKGIVEEFRIPVYISVGNHEIESETSEDIVRSVFEMPDNGPSHLKELVYSFDQDNAHFVIIDTDGYKNSHRLGNVQLEWLEDDLKKSGKEMKFVFGHKPAYPYKHHVRDSLDKYPAERDGLWDMFRQYKVAIYFCGHEHLYNSSMHEGVRQVVTGGAGARFHDTPEEGGFYHFILVQVKDEGVCEVTVKDIEGEIKDHFKIGNN
ncbi:MAG: metallophosphoesterase [Candidatus Omnitrophica bacterium]|nr:metallophosphoesterase [Candidatus Omnitrophota bacterium]